MLPDANVPTSIRGTGVPVLRGSVSELGSILDGWLASHAEGVACVISAGNIDDSAFRASSRVRALTPELSKGLEFDLVVLLDAEGSSTGTSGTGTSGAGMSGTGTPGAGTSGTGASGGGIEGAVDRYVAMTRATQQLVILTSP